METESWREIHREAFDALQELKKRTFIYEKKSTREHEIYQEILRNIPLINQALLCDDCCLTVNDEYGIIGITGLSSDRNVLRHNMTQEEMLFYIALLQIYLEKDISSGGSHAVHCTYDELRYKLQSIAPDPEFFKQRGGYRSDLGLENRLNMFNDHSLITVRKKMKDFSILPGILFCLNKKALDEQCQDVIATWEKQEKEASSNTRRTKHNAENSSEQITLFGDNESSINEAV